MATHTLQELFLELKHEMEAHEIPSKAANMANYLQNRFKCYGIKAPVRNEIQKTWFPKVKALGVNHWDVVYNLWSLDQREYQYIAIDYLNKVPKKEIEKDDWRNLEELFLSKSWWDSIDLVATNYTGKYFQKFPEQVEPVITRWRNSSNLWLNRVCLIFQLKYGINTDFELLKSLIRQYQGNPEFFVEKAIGWSLRQYGKFNPDAVVDFVHEIKLTGLAEREALRIIKKASSES